MPMIRINACGDAPELHLSPRPVWPTLKRASQTDGPVIIMIHGYKYLPGHSVHCPHRHLLSLAPEDLPWRSPSWPRQLGFGVGNAGEGLAIAFGWQARGALWQAQLRAVSAGRVLARVIRQLHSDRPDRQVHILAHSMGTELALEALHHIPAGAISRVISMTGACHQSRAMTALQTPAGQRTDFVNITSRENDPFDFLFERLITPPARGDRALGHGLQAPNAVTVQLDCPTTLEHLSCLGANIAPPQFRVCHWSSYMRPGVLRFYSNLLRRFDEFPLERLRQGLPCETAPRWSRLFAPPRLPTPLPFLQKA
ncbi:MAG: alpha/beta hydrolase [Rhodobacteraceae bacterium]|nr:alpha/beta hydrolase [Paracoccaceae bacterium]